MNSQPDLPVSESAPLFSFCGWMTFKHKQTNEKIITPAIVQYTRRPIAWGESSRMAVHLRSPLHDVTGPWEEIRYAMFQQRSIEEGKLWQPVAFKLNDPGTYSFIENAIQTYLDQANDSLKQKNASIRAKSCRFDEWFKGFSTDLVWDPFKDFGLTAPLLLQWVQEQKIQPDSQELLTNWLHQPLVHVEPYKPSSKKNASTPSQSSPTPAPSSLSVSSEPPSEKNLTPHRDDAPPKPAEVPAREVFTEPEPIFFDEIPPELIPSRDHALPGAPEAPLITAPPFIDELPIEFYQNSLSSESPPPVDDSFFESQAAAFNEPTSLMNSPFDHRSEPPLETSTSASPFMVESSSDHPFDADALNIEPNTVVTNETLTRTVNPSLNHSPSLVTSSVDVSSEIRSDVAIAAPVSPASSASNPTLTASHSIPSNTSATTSFDLDQLIDRIYNTPDDLYDAFENSIFQGIATFQTLRQYHEKNGTPAFFHDQSEPTQESVKPKEDKPVVQSPSPKQSDLGIKPVALHFARYPQVTHLGDLDWSSALLSIKGFVPVEVFNVIKFHKKATRPLTSNPDKSENLYAAEAILQALKKSDITFTLEKEALPDKFQESFEASHFMLYTMSLSSDPAVKNISTLVQLKFYRDKIIQLIHQKPHTVSGSSESTVEWTSLGVPVFNPYNFNVALNHQPPLLSYLSEHGLQTISFTDPQDQQRLLKFSKYYLNILPQCQPALDHPYLPAHCTEPQPFIFHKKPQKTP